MANAVSVIRQDAEGEHLWFVGGGLFTMKATAAETGGAFSLHEDREVRGKSTPLHLHPNDDEAMYVLEGEVLVHIDGQDHRVGEHGFFLAPRGVPHAFMVTSESARLLCLTTPGTGWAEEQYRELCDPAAPDAIPGSQPADFARLQEVAGRSKSIEIVGPPPFSAAQREATATAS